MDPWIVIVIIVSGICAAISLAITKKVSSSPATLLNKSIASGDVMSVIRQSEHQMKNGKSLSDRQQAAFIYCKFCAKNALSCYTQGFPYLKDPRDKVIFDVMYYMQIGKEDVAIDLCNKAIITADKQRAKTLRRLHIACYEFKFEIKEAYDLSMKYASGYSGNWRKIFGAQAWKYAYILRDITLLNAAQPFVDKKYSNIMLRDLDVLSGKILKAKEQGINLAEYMSRALEIYRGLKMPSLQKREMPVGDGATTFHGGATTYDNDELREKKAVFVMQIDLRNIPVEELKKDYAIRIWIAQDVIKYSSGLFVNSDNLSPRAGFDIRPVKNAFTIIKGYTQKLNTLSRFWEEGNMLVPRGYELAPECEFPHKYSHLLDDKFIVAGLRPIEEIDDESFVRKGDQGGDICCYPYTGKEYGEVGKIYDFCLARWVYGNEIYSVCVKAEDYEKDCFDNAVLIKVKD